METSDMNDDGPSVLKMIGAIIILISLMKPRPSGSIFAPSAG